jgi:hypothetical protein
MIERLIKIDQDMHVLLLHVGEYQGRPSKVLQEPWPVVRTPLHATRWERPKYRMVVVQSQTDLPKIVLALGLTGRFNCR